MRGKVVFVLAASSACLFPSLGDLSGDASPNDATTDVASDSPQQDGSPVDAPSDSNASDAKPGDAATDASDSGLTPGPITFVQLNTGEFNSGNTGLVSLANVKAHHTLIMCAGYDAQGPLTVSDTQNDAFTQYVAYDSTALGGPGENFVWAAFNVAGGNVTVTATTQTGHDYFEVYLIEYSGLTAFDVEVSGQGTTTATDGMASGFATTTFGNDLLLGYGTDGDGVQGTNFTLRSGFESDVLEDRIVSTAGSYQATATMEDGTGWEISMVAFKGF